jgi:hypothetical protein
MTRLLGGSCCKRAALAAPCRGTGGVTSACGSRLEELEHGEDPPVLAGRLIQSEFVEDAGHVAFHRRDRNREFLRDAGVGAPFGHQREHFQLTGTQGLEGTGPPLAAHQAGDHVRIEGRPAGGDAADGIGEQAQVADFLLEQVTGAPVPPATRSNA